MKEKKPSRITTACNACRSRKQKCSGKKPVCEQCYEYNRPCNWPEQLRRGPAKGYIEALEHRLQVTESVLLRLLSQVSDPELSKVFPTDSLLSDGSGYAPLARLEKKGIEEWSRYPLDSVQSIRKWQRTCTGQGSDEVGCQSVESEPSSTKVQGRKKQNMMDTHRQEQISSSIQMTSGNSPSGRPLSGPGHRATFAEIGSESPGRSDHGVRGSDDDDDRDVNTTMQSRSSWEGAPSISFQEQFMW